MASVVLAQSRPDAHSEEPCRLRRAELFHHDDAGWVSADEPTRHRIVETAQTYLTTAQSSVDLWFGKNPMPLHSNDLSAARAFILLRQQAPDAYAAIPQAVWEKWTPVIVGLRLSVGNEFSDDVRHIQRDALATRRRHSSRRCARCFTWRKHKRAPPRTRTP